MLTLMSVKAAVAGAGSYMSQDAFLQRVFGAQQPVMGTLWLDQSRRGAIRELIGRDYAGARIRYWHEGSKTAWVLEEVGKVKPITVGIGIDKGAIVDLSILTFRESRGYEVRYPFFTEQFSGAALDEQQLLSQGVDNISGATLSVRAVKKTARLALWLDGQVNPS